MIITNISYDIWHSIIRTLLRSLARGHSIIKFCGTKLIKKGSDEYIYVFRSDDTCLYKWVFLCETHGIIH